MAIFEFVIVVFNLARDFDNVKLFLCNCLCISFKEFDLGEDGKSYQIYRLSKLAVLPMAVQALLTVVVSVWAIAALAVTIKQSRLVSNKTHSSDAKKESFLKKIHDKFKGCGAIVMINTTSLAMIIAFLTLVIRLGDSPLFDINNVTFF